MNITKGDNLNKPAIIVISRQHPPEVTGFFAMKAFIETLIEVGRFSNRPLVFFFSFSLLG